MSSILFAGLQQRCAKAYFDDSSTREKEPSETPEVAIYEQSGPVLDEDDIYDRMYRMQPNSKLEFPSSLNAYQRHRVHELAQNLGLRHQSFPSSNGTRVVVSSDAENRGRMPGDWDCSSCGNLNFRRRDVCNICSKPRNDAPPLANAPDDSVDSRVQSRLEPPAAPRIEARHARDSDFETPRNRDRDHARERERERDFSRRHRTRDRSPSRDVSRNAKRHRQRSHEKNGPDSGRGEKYSAKAPGRRASYACLWCKSMFQAWTDCTKHQRGKCLEPIMRLQQEEIRMSSNDFVPRSLKSRCQTLARRLA